MEKSFTGILKSIWKVIRRGLQLFMLGFIKFYRKCISPYTPRCCRYTPSCSQYAYEAVMKYGPIKGGWMAFKRVLRCNPFHKGGYDPVP